jgi:RecA/RadA recombinase
MAKKKTEWLARDYYAGILDKIEKKYGQQSRNPYEDLFHSRMSTGILSLDLIAGGGIPPGRWTTIMGPESSGKSTLLYTILNAALTLKVPNILLYDYETSVEPVYLKNITKLTDKEIFGVKEDKHYEFKGEDGKLSQLLGSKKSDKKEVWRVKPKIRYYTPNTGEFFFKSLHWLIQSLPDTVEYKGRYFQRYTKALKKSVGLPDDRVEFKEGDFYYVSYDGPPIQVLALIDSYPEMSPEASKEKPDGNPQAVHARMFSTYIPLIRSAMSSKGVAIVGINHIRMRPMVMFGSPEYCPGGEHLKLAEDIRIRVANCAIPHAKGRIEEEMSLTGDLERFVYSKANTKKNKTFPKDKTTHFRICFESKGVSGYGIDYVWDLFEYLKATGQVKKRGNRIKIADTLPGPWCDTELTWDDLRLLVHKPVSSVLLKKLMEDKQVTKIVTSKLSIKVKANKLRKLLDIRSACFKQISDRTAFYMTADAITKTKEEE